MKVKEIDIRRVIAEVLADLEPKTRLSMDSLDDQIDSFLIKYEDESIDDQKQQEESWHFEPSLKFLFEKEGEDEEETDTAEEPEEPEAEDDKTTDSSDQTVDGPSEPAKPPIDISKYTNHVVRLLDHPTSLLDLQTVIINRAKKFLETNYSPESVTEFESILEKQHGVSLNPANNEPERHLAVGAGPTG